MLYALALVAIVGAPIAQAADEPPVVQADLQQRPLWEFGLGVGARQLR